MDSEKSFKLSDLFGLDSPPVSFDFPSTMDVLLGYFEGYVRTMEGLLEKEGAAARKRYDEAGDYRVRDYLEEGLFVVEDLFPNLLRSSFFLAAYTTLEDGLRNRCRCLQELNDFPFSADEIAGRAYLQKYRMYIERLAHIDFKGIGEWDKLSKYGELRNRVAHHQGHLNLGNANLMKFIADNPNLDVEEDVIVFRKGFCEEVIDTIKSFFQSLDAQLPADCEDLEPHFGYSP